MKTYSAKPLEIERKWYILDAEGQKLGRLAALAANLLRGKHKPQYTPHVDTGDFVIVINAEKIEVSGNKETDKKYYRHSGYPGGLKTISFKALMEKEREFWEQYVIPEIPPPMDGKEVTGKALNAIYSETVYDSIPIKATTAISNFIALQSQIKALEDERDMWKHEIQKDMGEHESAYCGHWNISWKSQTRMTFDYKAFIADNDDLDLDDYFTTTKYRKFEIKEAK